MPCAIKNEKGLNGACHEIALAPVSALKRVAEIKAGAHGLSEEEAALAAKMASLLLSLPGRGSKDWYNSKNNTDWVKLKAWPSGWANAQQPYEGSEAQVRQEWALVSQAREMLSKAQPALKKIGQDLANLDDKLPKASAIKRMAGWTVEAAGAETAARAGEAWAIWMGGARELGYMDGKKRPAGAAGARLFESEKAALRTAKAARFGSDRGPAAIVRLIIEPLEVMPGAKGMDAVRAELSRLESEELSRSMEEASLERLREALGEAPAPAPQIMDSGSLAGAEEGFARWVSGGDEKAQAGFLNYDQRPGPLAGAQLHPTERGARDASYWWGALSEDGVARVRARPIEIGELIGEPNVKELSKAIEIERDHREAQALARADQEALKARAAALQSGEATPAPRRSRSL